MRIGLIGYGRMGQAVERVATARGHAIAGVIRRDTPPDQRVQIARQSDALIDFSLADAVPANVALALQTRTPLVIGATGWDAQREAIAQQVRAAGGSALYAPNFSIAVQAFLQHAVSLAAQLLALEGWDVAIEEIHHRGKADAPSGTARALATRLQDALNHTRTAQYPAPADHRLPDAQFSIGVVRLGSEFGAHRLMLDGPYDWIEVAHRAKSRDGFAYGAVRAAEWLVGRTGFFAFAEVLSDILTPKEER
ncbi:MAG: dihydrodipicolinate reductase C-terminal domain-containing protein [Fimbriimonadales bacterium]|nr:MAG: 4-hydroxy-tetrahydrodipicolinate reductase [Fimbriimonadales bacterium]